MVRIPPDDDSSQWLSLPALRWAFDEAPNVPPGLVSTLLAVARHAGEDGRDSYPSAKAVAKMTRKSETQAKRDMARLKQLGLLLPGDPDAAKGIRADRRPKVWNLPMPRGASRRTPQGSRGASGRTPLKRSRGASGNGTGCIWPPNGVHPDAPEEARNKKRNKQPRTRTGHDNLFARAVEAVPDLTDDRFEALLQALCNDEQVRVPIAVVNRAILDGSLAQLLNDRVPSGPIERDPEWW